MVELAVKYSLTLFKLGKQMKNFKQKPLILAMGTTLVSGLSVTAVHAETVEGQTNPFAMTDLSEGYMQLAEAKTDEGSGKMKSGSCGEGKCGSSMMQGNDDKTVEGNCAGNKPMPKAKNKTKAEGKCGEGKCGDMK